MGFFKNISPGYLPSALLSQIFDHPDVRNGLVTQEKFSSEIVKILKEKYGTSKPIQDEILVIKACHTHSNLDVGVAYYDLIVVKYYKEDINHPNGGGWYYNRYSAHGQIEGFQIRLKDIAYWCSPADLSTLIVYLRHDISFPTDKFEVYTVDIPESQAPHADFNMTPWCRKIFER